MADSNDVLKRFGFNDSQYSWIFYNESCQQFFEHFKNRITNANIVDETEILLYEQICSQSLNGGTPKGNGEAETLQRDEQIDAILNSDHLLEIQCLQDELKVLEEIEREYSDYQEDFLRNFERSLTCQLSDLELEAITLERLYGECYQRCLGDKAKSLEAIQMENFNLYNEAKTRCLQVENPAFVHQLNPMQYLQKIEFFSQNFEMFIKSNFKIQDSSAELEIEKAEMDLIEGKLSRLERNLTKFSFGYLEEKRQFTALQSLFKHYDLSKIRLNSVSDLLGEITRLKYVSERLMLAYETLSAELKALVKERIDQRIDLVLVVNTRSKLEAARKRLDDLKQVKKLTSSVVGNAELLWIVNQLDVEKIRNNVSHHDKWNEQAKACARRIRTMHSLQALPSNATGSLDILFQSISEIFKNSNLGTAFMQCPNDKSKIKCFLHEYANLNRSNGFSIKNLVKKEPYSAAAENMRQLCAIEDICKRFVYDGPLSLPSNVNVNFLPKIIKANSQQMENEKLLRSLRTEFQAISERTNNDKFYRASQLLWVWFLMEPKRMVLEIEEAKKAAAHLPSLAISRQTSGIKRK